MENAEEALVPLDIRRELVEIVSEPELMRAAAEALCLLIPAVLSLSEVAVLALFCRSLSAKSLFCRCFEAALAFFQ